MAVRPVPDSEEMSVGSGLDIESRFYRHKYQILGHDNANAAIAALANFTSRTQEAKLPIDGEDEPRTFVLYRQPLTVSRVGFKLYESEVVWNLKQTSEFSITIRGRSTGGTQHIRGSFFTAGASKDAPNCQGLIGFDPDKNEVQGCEIIVPQVELEIECLYPPGTVTDTYLGGCENLTGFVNATAWRRWQSGQVLYKGCEFTQGSTEPTRVVHYVGIEKNLTNITVAGLKGVTKEGWDFLWFRSEDGIDRGLPVKIPRHWYSERVYPRTDFKAVLGF